MTKTLSFLRIDDRLIHGQVIVGWLPEIKPDTLAVVNDKINADAMRQELMALSVPHDIELKFFSVAGADEKEMTDNTFVLVSSPKDAYECIQKGFEFKRFNIGGMHSGAGKEEIFEALHVDEDDRYYFELIMEAGVDPVFQPTPQNEPMPLGDIL